MYWVYVLYSKTTNLFYKGQTNDLGSRLARHNGGFEKYTRKGVPWVVIWKTCVGTRAEAIALERKLKNLSRKRLIEFINKYRQGCAGPDIS